MTNKRKVMIWIIIVAILIIILLYYVVDNKIKINLINNQSEEIEDLKNQLGIEKQKRENIEKELETEKQYLERMDNKLTFCETDLDCVKGINGCCSSKALNKKYESFWLQSQAPCNMACTPEQGMWEFALCENNRCILMDLHKCEKDSDCEAYDFGCGNKEYVNRVRSKWLTNITTDEWTCKCSNSECEIFL